MRSGEWIWLRYAFLMGFIFGRYSKYRSVIEQYPDGQKVAAFDFFMSPRIMRELLRLWECSMEEIKDESTLIKRAFIVFEPDASILPILRVNAPCTTSDVLLVQRIPPVGVSYQSVGRAIST